MENTLYWRSLHCWLQIWGEVAYQPRWMDGILHTAIGNPAIPEWLPLTAHPLGHERQCWTGDPFLGWKIIPSKICWWTLDPGQRWSPQAFHAAEIHCPTLTYFVQGTRWVIFVHQLTNTMMWSCPRILEKLHPNLWWFVAMAFQELG